MTPRATHCISGGAGWLPINLAQVYWGEVIHKLGVSMLSIHSPLSVVPCQNDHEVSLSDERATIKVAADLPPAETGQPQQ